MKMIILLFLKWKYMIFILKSFTAKSEFEKIFKYWKRKWLLIYLGKILECVLSVRGILIFAFYGKEGQKIWGSWSNIVKYET